MSLLDEILSAHGVSAPTGAPLYRYRLTSHLRSRLEDALAEHCRNRRYFEGAAAALFCLYAADRFRTHADGDVWCWAAVTEAIGWRGPYAELQRGVSRGLRWWRRLLFETAKGRRFLATLVNEGGGPLGLLGDAHTGASLKVFLRRLLIDRERFRLQLTNNAAERLLRTLVIDRKTWLFVGSDRSAQRTADALTILMTCQHFKIDPRRYIRDTLQRILSGIKDLAALLPENYVPLEASAR